MQNNNQLYLNHKLLLRIIELTLLALLIALFARPLFVDLPKYFTWIILGSIILVTSLYGVVSYRMLPKWEMTLALITGLVIILPTLAISGGVNSQVACILPLYPIFAALIGGYRESLLFTVILAIGAILATFFAEHIPDITNEAFVIDKTLDRGFWLTLSIIFSGLFGRFFLRRYNEVTNQLKSETIQDPLTGLLNRRGLSLHFERELEHAERTSEPLSIILLDIDYFKKVNDLHGHDIGDFCLIEIGQVLSNTIRKQDIIARFGGEEFLILLPNTSQEEALKLAENLREQVAKDKFSPARLPLSITLGVGERNSHDDNAFKMIKRADTALYNGKGRGRNCAVAFNPNEIT